MKLFLRVAALTIFSISCHHPSQKAKASDKDSLAKQDSIKKTAPYYFDKNKPYPFQSGMVLYRYAGDYEGVQKLYFMDYGKRQRVEDSFVNKKSAIQTVVRQVFISDSAKLYFIDLSKNNGYYIKRTDTSSKLEGNLLYDMSRLGIDSTMRKNGYKPSGTETISGKTCRVYASGNSKFCFYDGLNIKTDMLGKQFKYTLEAVSIKENTAMDELLFSPPAGIDLLEYKKFVKSQTRDKL